MRKKTVKVKKQKIIGKQQYINTETGEVIDATVIIKEITSDFNFHKVWINDLMAILNLIGNKKIIILNYLLGKMRNEDNIVIAKYSDIKKDLRVSDYTISETIKMLIETNFIKKIQNGVYMVNPDIVVKGKTGKRQGLLTIYKEKEKEIDNE